MAGRNIVEELYISEQQQCEQEVQNVKITVSMRAEDAGFFTALAERFDTTRLNILEPAFKELAEEMFINLEHKDRLIVAKNADREATELYKKQGVNVETVGSEGTLTEIQSWRNYADMCFRLSSEEQEK